MDYIEGFKIWLMEKGKSENTISCYIRDVTQLRRYASIYGFKIGRDVPQIFLQYFKEFQKCTGASITTINRRIASINTFYRYLYKSGFIDEEFKIDPYRDKNINEYKGLTEQQLWKLRSEIHKSKNKMHICIFEILINIGIRVSELVGIKLSDIKISQRKGNLTVIGKGQAVRTIPLNKTARNASTEYLKVRRNDESEYLLIGQRGNLNRNAVNLILKKCGDRVCIKVTPHMIRHTLGYNLIKKGIVITTIQ